MGLTVLALIMTVFMGGLIAYNGDLIGRKFGKRRVTMLGLRPKHTAILITSVTGIFISALTTGVLFMLVKPVRTVILEGEEAIRQMPILKQQKRETEQLMLASSARAALLQNDIAKLTTAKREVDLALGSAQKALKASLSSSNHRSRRGWRLSEQACDNAGGARKGRKADRHADPYEQRSRERKRRSQ